MFRLFDVPLFYSVSVLWKSQGQVKKKKNAEKKKKRFLFRVWKRHAVNMSVNKRNGHRLQHAALLLLSWPNISFTVTLIYDPELIH